MPSCILAFLTARRKLGAAPISAKIWVSFSDSVAVLGVRKDGVAAVAGSAAGRAAWVEEEWLAGAFAPVERRGASGRVASSGQRRGRVIEPVHQRLDQKGEEKMDQNPWLCLQDQRGAIPAGDLLALTLCKALVVALWNFRPSSKTRAELGSMSPRSSFSRISPCLRMRSSARPERASL